MMTYADRTDMMKEASGLDYDGRREVEKRMEEAKSDKCKRLCREVAKALGEPWHAVDKVDGDGRYWRTTIVGEPERNESLYVNLSPYHARGRMIFSGDFPHSKRGHSLKPYKESFEITVNEDRPPEEIAKELKRRLLPKYLKAVAEATRIKHEHDGKDVQRLFRYEELIKALGAGEIVNRDSDCPDFRLYRRSGDEGHALKHLEGKAHYDNGIDLKLEVSYELALELMKFIRKHGAVGGGQMSL